MRGQESHDDAPADATGRLPEWLIGPCPESDVWVSSRVRVMRNLAGYPFPHRCDLSQRQAILQATANASRPAGLSPYLPADDLERNLLVGARLVSAELARLGPGQAVLLDAPWRLSLLVNEEDHLRLQSIRGGNQLASAYDFAHEAIGVLRRELTFAHHPSFGYLASSPANTGPGVRLSFLLHLVGLASERRVAEMLDPLVAQGVSVRGVFGEASRSVGAFVQISLTQDDPIRLARMAQTIAHAEREARRRQREVLSDRLANSVQFLRGSHLVSLEDALRSLAWLRWAASEGHIAATPQQIDLWTARLATLGDPTERAAARHRANLLHTVLANT